MTILDRYILRSYLKVLLICFISFSGMYVVLDGFNNLDDFLAYGSKGGGVAAVLAEYYPARVLTFFDMTSDLLALMAAMFVFAALQRRNELTALMAGGVPGARAAAPLMAAAVGVSLLGVVNREVWIPRQQAKLARNAQNWLGEKPTPVQARYDHETNIYLDGRHAFGDQRRIAEPSLRLPRSLHKLGRRLIAENAYYQPASEGLPSGYLMDRVLQPAAILTGPSISIDGEAAILTPASVSWLKPDQCFVISRVEFQQLSNSDTWRQFSSTWDLVAALHNPSLDFGADVRVTVHSRLVKPVLDVLLMMMCLPLILIRGGGSIFSSVGKCILTLIVFRLVVMASQQMGAAYLITPALAAWLPVMIFSPVAVFMYHKFWD